MRFVRLLAALVAVVLAHLAGSWLWPGFPRAVDLFIVLVVLGALRSSSLAGMLTGMAVGLVHDTLTGGLYGLHGFADTIIGYVAARAAQRLVIEHAAGVMAAVAVATLTQQAILVGLKALLLGQPEAAATPWWWLLKALVSGAIAAAVFLAVRAGRQGAERRRHDRGSKLRFGR